MSIYYLIDYKSIHASREHSPMTYFLPWPSIKRKLATDRAYTTMT